MLSGVMLIIVTMFAVLGVYYTAEVAAEFFAKRKLTRTVMVTAYSENEGIYETVMHLRRCVPECEVVVLCNDGNIACEKLAGSMRGVHFTTCDNAVQLICDVLAL